MAAWGAAGLYGEERGDIARHVFIKAYMYIYELISHGVGGAWCMHTHFTTAAPCGVPSDGCGWACIIIHIHTTDGCGWAHRSCRGMMHHGQGVD